jgi:5'-nucleotidase
MPRLFLTNDDSHRSPLLGIVLKVAKRFGELTVVVPKEEQSWRAKAISRFGHLHLEPCELFGHPSYTLTGTPADCTGVGVYHLFDSPPDLVLSGINAGLNTGTGFLFSSGTVGACLEANIAGVPALALSQELDTPTRNKYMATYALEPETLARFEAQVVPRLERLLEVFLTDGPLRREPVTWNVNFPFLFGPEEPFVVAPLGDTRYGSCFVEEPGFPAGRSFRHDLKKIEYDPREECDSALLRRGKPTITPLDMRSFGQSHPLVPVLPATLFESLG